MEENKDKLDTLGKILGFKEEEITSFFYSLSGIDDNGFKREIFTLLSFGMSFDLSKLKKKPTQREEGNVITAYCFRNTMLEEIHADYPGRKLDNQTMKDLMIESSSKVTNWLKMRDALKNSAPSVYYFLINTYQMMYTSNWYKG